MPLRPRDRVFGCFLDVLVLLPTPVATGTGTAGGSYRCWIADPAKRPTFEEIVAILKDMRDAAAAGILPEWLPVPNPQVSFLQQVMLQRRATSSLPSPAAPGSRNHPGVAAAVAAPSPGGPASRNQSHVQVVVSAQQQQQP
ncbi:hypothetical protein Vretimale_1265 [Volvox reticuliferus]|uniref:Protein kinase domain-containing protein n=1 Tax=Volvox reticuliferus TaxID=1737510 RepID=A0A8J4G3A4_9CHLO|nr:hypothetical protein Vretimale_1265 [Volvox reticuliferus]